MTIVNFLTILACAYFAGDAIEDGDYNRAGLMVALVIINTIFFVGNYFGIETTV